MKKALAVMSLVVSFSSCQSNTIGIACTADSDCESGQSCFMNGFPGGFCTKGCVLEGRTTDCPGGTICTSTSTTGSTLFCSNLCNADSDCRGGSYACNGVTQTNLKACRP